MSLHLGLYLVYLLHMCSFFNLTSLLVSLLALSRPTLFHTTALWWTFNNAPFNSLTKIPRIQLIHDSKRLHFGTCIFILLFYSPHSYSFTLLELCCPKNLATDCQVLNPRDYGEPQEVVDHLTNIPPNREKISQPEINMPTSSLRFGCLSTVIR